MTNRGDCVSKHAPGAESVTHLESLASPFGAIVASLIEGRPRRDLMSENLLRLSRPLSGATFAFLGGRNVTQVYDENILSILEASPGIESWHDVAIATAFVNRIELTAPQRTRAAKALAALLASDWHREVRRISAPESWIRAAITAAFCVAPVWKGLSTLSHSLLVRGSLPVSPDVLSMGVVIMLVFCGLLLARLPIIFDREAAERESLVKATTATVLGRLESPGHLGALARAALDTHEIVREAGLVALLRTIPLLEPQHYGTLSHDAVPDLCRLLYPMMLWLPNDSDESVSARIGRRIEILDALHIVGDGRAVDSVRELADRALSSEVRSAAERVLPILEERLRRERDSDLLLRPRGVPISELLVRPAAASLNEPTEQLLRPAAGEPNSRAA